MAGFSSSEINDAKRRVWEMRERAKSFVEDAPPQENNEEEIIEEQQNTNSNFDSNRAENSNSSDFFTHLGLNNIDFSDSSSALVLALILILSREKADNMLILALLYILL